MKQYLIGIDIGVGVALLIGLAVILMQIFPQWKNCFVKTNRKEENNNEKVVKDTVSEGSGIQTDEQNNEQNDNKEDKE